MPGGLSSYLHFFHDASNKLVIVELSGAEYAYVHNLQGDIVAILDNEGTAVVQYQYDAWGRPIGKTGSMAGTLGTVQPFRYRGYVYDEETGLYYLRSRYFNIAWSRFIQTDNILTDLANLYAYCENSPTNKVDPNGNISAIARVDGGVAPDDFKRFWKALGAAIGASVAVSVSALTVANTKTTDQTRSVTKVNLPDPNPDPNDVRKYSVYFLLDDTDTVQYVGRTCNVGAREAAHKRNPFRAGLHMGVIMSGLTLSEARGYEQIFMVWHHTLNRGNPKNNQINGIRSGNAHFDQYIVDAVTSMLMYFENFVDNELLNLLGK